MTNKFKATKGGKKAQPVAEAEKDLTNEEILEQIKAMHADYNKKIDVLTDNLHVKLDEIDARYHGVSGIVDGMQAFKLIDYTPTITEIRDLCDHAVFTVNRIIADMDYELDLCNTYDLYPAKYDWCKDFLDEYIDDNFVEGVAGWPEVAGELVDCNICQEIWEHLRRLPEFHDTVYAEVKKLADKIGIEVEDLCEDECEKSE